MNEVSAPGVDVDGFAIIERLSSVLLGDDRDAQLKDEALKEHTQLLKRLLAGSLCSL